MIKGGNESKSLTKHISHKCESTINEKKCSSNQKWNKDKFRCKLRSPKEYRVCEKGHSWNPSTCTCQNGSYMCESHRNNKR